MDSHDVIVVGGSFAGLSAAMYLARARRKVLVLDSGLPRNRFSAHSHGVLALDGQPGPELLATARAQLAKYPTATQLGAEVRRVIRRDGPLLFEVHIESGERFEARRLILATGLVDLPPAIPGLEQRWGKSVFHCPYCDGYEFEGGPIGVLATLPLSVHFVKIVADWGKTTLFTNRVIEVDEGERSLLASKGIDVRDEAVVSLEGGLDGRLERVRLEGGESVPLRALFIGTIFRQASTLAQELGCELLESPRGPLVKTDESKQTTIPGVYAAGDMARPTHSIPFAVSDGATAGTSAHQSLVAEQPD
jgi:thioredoxin reductase